jgi:2-polyprenyl-3-methyl-5-hydroxy-6-metoxy-1,4-benzoquinol methylase
MHLNAKESYDMKNRKGYDHRQYSCWCGSKGGHRQMEGHWQNVPDTIVSLAQCGECQTIRTLMCTYNEYVETTYLNSLSQRHQNSLKTIKKYCTGRVLDIGCNCGEILNNLWKSENYTHLVGIDSNIKAIELGKETYGLDIRYSTIDEIIEKEEVYDSIIMTHVFEHILFPLKFLQKIQKLLDPSGPRQLYLCVPNIENANIFYFGALDPREHYWHYSIATLTKLIEHAFPTAEIVYAGTSNIWSNNEQIEMVVCIPPIAE